MSKAWTTKRWLFPLALVLIGWLLFARTFFSGQIFKADDGELHAARIASYYLAAKQGQLPPSWGPNLNHGFGYPVFIFTYPLPYVLGSSLFAAGMSVEWSLNLVVLAMSLVFVSGVGCLTWIKTENQWLSTAFSLAFLSSIYWLMDVFVRMAIGEICFLALLPWVLILITERHRLKNKWWWLFGWIILTSWFLTHQVLILFSLPILLLWAWQEGVFKEGIKSEWMWLGALSMGTVMFSWLPLVFEKGLIQFNNSALLTTYQSHFSSWGQLFWRDWGYAGAGESVGLTSFPATMGLVWWALALMTTFSWKKKGYKAFPWFELVLLVASLQLPFSAPIWKLGILNVVMFPWRLLWLGMFATWLGFLHLLTKSKIEPKLIGLIIFILITSSFYKLLQFAKPVGYISNPTHEWLEYAGTTATLDEHLTQEWDQGKNLKLVDQVVLRQENSTYFDQDNQPIGATGQAEIMNWTGTQMSYSVATEKPAWVIQKTMYYPGWQVIVDGQEVEIQNKDEEFPGRIMFQVEAGEHQVEVRFEQNEGVRKIGNYLTILSVIIGVGYFSLKQPTPSRRSVAKG